MGELEMAVVMGQGSRREQNIHYKVSAKAKRLIASHDVLFHY